MLTIRDHATGSLFDPWDHLGPKRRHLLEHSWAGVFRQYLLTSLPVERLAPHLCADFGRPSKDLSMVLGALILQQLHDLTDAQTVEAVALNIAWHYALDIRHEADAYFCERTLRNYRRLVITENLDEMLFRTLTDALITSVGVDTSKQRLDSTAVRSAMRRRWDIAHLNRLGILVETISKFLRELKRVHPDLFGGVDAQYWGRYVQQSGLGCFACAKPGQAKRHLPEAADDLYRLMVQFQDSDAAALPSFQLLVQVFDDQCEVVGTGEDDTEAALSVEPDVRVKSPAEMPCDNIVNPSDPDARYNKNKGFGYLVQVMETYTDTPTSEKDAFVGQQPGKAIEVTDSSQEVTAPDLITHVAVGKINVHDKHALEPALNDVAQRDLLPELLLADTHYGVNG